MVLPAVYPAVTFLSGLGDYLPYDMGKEGTCGEPSSEEEGGEAAEGFQQADAVSAADCRIDSCGMWGVAFLVQGRELPP